MPHIAELRRRIVAALAVFLAFTVAAFVFSSRIVSFLLAPLEPFDVELHIFAPADQFMAYLSISFWTGLICALPFLCLQAALFIWPALRKNEYRYACAALVIVPALFILGAAAAYRFLSPVVFGFFLTFGEGDGMRQLWGLRQYLALLSRLMLAAGLLSQGPLILLALMATGAVSHKSVARFRCHIILLIFFLAALLTPPDVISQILLGIPLYLLFEGALFLGRIFSKRRS